MRHRDMTARLLWNSVLELGSECWLWIGYRDRDGYGRVTIRDERGPRMQQAHRIALETFTGERVPASWDVHHTCGNRSCINPAHLEAMWHEHNCATGNRNNHHAGSFKARRDAHADRA